MFPPLDMAKSTMCMWPPSVAYWRIPARPAPSSMAYCTTAMCPPRVAHDSRVLVLTICSSINIFASSTLPYTYIFLIKVVKSGILNKVVNPAILYVFCVCFHSCLYESDMEETVWANQFLGATLAPEKIDSSQLAPLPTIITFTKGVNSTQMSAITKATPKTKDASKAQDGPKGGVTCSYPECKTPCGAYRYCGYHNHIVIGNGLCYDCLGFKERMTDKQCRACWNASRQQEIKNGKCANFPRCTEMAKGGALCAGCYEKFKGRKAPLNPTTVAPAVTVTEVILPSLTDFPELPSSVTPAKKVGCWAQIVSQVTSPVVIPQVVAHLATANAVIPQASATVAPAPAPAPTANGLLNTAWDGEDAIDYTVKIVW